MSASEVRLIHGDMNVLEQREVALSVQTSQHEGYFLWRQHQFVMNWTETCTPKNQSPLTKTESLHYSPWWINQCKLFPDCAAYVRGTLCSSVIPNICWAAATEGRRPVWTREEMSSYDKDRKENTEVKSGRQLTDASSAAPSKTKLLFCFTKLLRLTTG